MGFGEDLLLIRLCKFAAPRLFAHGWCNVAFTVAQRVRNQRNFAAVVEEDVMVFLLFGDVC